MSGKSTLTLSRQKRCLESNTFFFFFLLGYIGDFVVTCQLKIIWIKWLQRESFICFQGGQLHCKSSPVRVCALFSMCTCLYASLSQHLHPSPVYKSASSSNQREASQRLQKICCAGVVLSLSLERTHVHTLGSDALAGRPNPHIYHPWPSPPPPPLLPPVPLMCRLHGAD